MSLEGLNVCISGTMMSGDRKQMIDLVEKHGAHWQSMVNRSTNVLIIHPNELSPPTRTITVEVVEFIKNRYS
jgi:NAD-dependent DNA ligase